MADDKLEVSAAAAAGATSNGEATVTNGVAASEPLTNGSGPEVDSANPAGLDGIKAHIKTADKETIDKQRELAQRLMTLKELGIQDQVEENERSVEEIKQIDSQMNRLNHALERIEKHNNEVNAKLQATLDEAQKARQERKASLQQREREYKEQQAQFDSQLLMVMEASRANREGRKVSLPELSSVGDLAAALSREPQIATLDEHEDEHAASGETAAAAAATNGTS